ncbi:MULTISPECIES: zeta toxin family protein [unclassified Lysobacter]|uniref:zeta toxin family protein n=1 Tax=unclassified Lysobacter TaxID=2635362 RepID=UPI001BE53B67|nr:MULTISPECIES: zeta toxin family protein [unclassified Lysobacter]MBT2746584.1 zeta toxin family protein [Lysobacter sp. ISL-42]MBT2753421.1 zeta toxin family protein [Lysobacter sp. ISL-50]MBT2775531.1 zeta toxin family protein [Lysobacter sp. ISL-54]MBT2782933.1 zeta toxin family protein [Lysobacter sp. ISL-52]
MSASDTTLDKETYERVLREKILPDSGFYETTAQARPKAIFLAGQPGAGKGGLKTAAQTELGFDVVAIDPDELRDQHPDVERFREERPVTWADDTHPDASKWAKELRGIMVEERRNIIVDTTLGNGHSVAEQIKGLQAQGYEVEIRAMAAHRLESELGVDQRFTKGIKERGFGRYVPEDLRTQVYKDLPGNLNHVSAETGVQIRIFNREGALLYDNRASPLAPGAALEQARDARLKDPKVTQFVHEGLKAQLVVHRDLAEDLKRNSKVPPPIATALVDHLGKSGAVESVQHLANEAAPIDHAVRVRPAELKAAATGVLRTAAVAAVAYDVTTTTHEASRQYDQGNLTGVESKIVGTASRSVGGFGGMAAGAAIGAGVTAETGPGALVGCAIGGIAGAVAGDKAAEWIDQYRINHQNDKDGNTWTFLPAQPQQGWTRRELDLDAMSRSDGAPVYKPQVLKADPALADRLNFQASGRAVELALSAPPKPQNPYSLPASVQDARGIEESNWERNAATKQWTRQVAVGQVDLGATSYRTDLATPQRAAELEKQSQAVIADNATRTPLALAANYKTAYDQYDWSRHGEMPAAVKDAIKHPGHMLASDGDTYERSADGQWTSRGMVWDSKAQGNIKQELDATYQRQQSGPKITTLEPVEVHADPEPTRTASAAPTPTQRSTPEDPGHPDRALYEKVRGAVEQLDRQAGKPWDQQSERMTASALAMAAEKKFEAKDDIRLAFNPPTADLAAGERVHVYRVGHPSPDPAAHQASMKTADALSVPVEARYQQVEATRIAQAEQAQREQQQAQARAQEQSNQSAPKMTV